MAKRKIRKDVNTKKRTHQTTDDAFEITHEMSDIPGNQVQLKVKERDLDPFFKSLLDKHKPLPKHVSFRYLKEVLRPFLLGPIFFSEPHPGWLPNTSWL